MHEEQFGTGEEVLAKGQAITYSSDAAYMLMNEIALPSENIWTLPEGLLYRNTCGGCGLICEGKRYRLCL